MAPTAPNKAVSTATAIFTIAFQFFNMVYLLSFFGFNIAPASPFEAGASSFHSLTRSIAVGWSVACIVVGWSVASVVVACRRVILRLAGLDGVLGRLLHTAAGDERLLALTL